MNSQNTGFNKLTLSFMVSGILLLALIIFSIGFYDFYAHLIVDFINFSGRENINFQNELLKSSTVQEDLHQISLFQTR